jgi:hypothetical protein
MEPPVGPHPATVRASVPAAPLSPTMPCRRSVETNVVHGLDLFPSAFEHGGRALGIVS